MSLRQNCARSNHPVEREFTIREAVDKYVDISFLRKQGIDVRRLIECTTK